MHKENKTAKHFMDAKIKTAYDKLKWKVKRKLKIFRFNFQDLISFTLAILLFCCLWSYPRTSLRVEAEFRILDRRISLESRSSLKTNKSQASCQLPRQVPLQSNPLIKVDQERFLIPLLINGPNNQVIGLRDSIFLTICLNRTLILPRFYRHKSNVTVDPELRIDLQKLSSLISIRKSTDVNELCKNEKVALFITDRSSWMILQGPSYRRLAYLSGIKSLHGGSKKDIPLYPREKRKNLQLQHGTLQLIKELYSSEHRCAVYVYPFRSVGTRESAVALREAKTLMSNPATQINPTKLSPELLYSLGYVNSPKPLFLRQLAAEFRTDFLRNQSSIAIHWRFDPEDWMLRCEKQDKSDGKQNVIDMCNKLGKITSQDIAQGIIQFLDRLKDHKNITVKLVYFAAPLTLCKLINDVRDAIMSANIKIFTYSDVEKHLKKHSDCDFVRNHFNDILSSIEMELCLHSTIFLSSDTSSWSSNIIRDRTANKWSKDDDSILNIVWDAHQIRQSKIIVLT